MGKFSGENIRQSFTGQNFGNFYQKCLVFSLRDRILRNIMLIYELRIQTIP